jgi:hypothetical protein
VCGYHGFKQLSEAEVTHEIINDSNIVILSILFVKLDTTYGVERKFTFDPTKPVNHPVYHLCVSHYEMRTALVFSLIVEERVSMFGLLSSSKMFM